jgi:AraC family transcriptional regulator
MDHSQPELNRFFVRPQYSIHYRRLKKLNWTNDARSDYGVLLVLNGDLEFKAGETAGKISQDQSLLINPSLSTTATGAGVELLLLTISAAYILERAVRMRLIVQGALVVFQHSLVKRDAQLSESARTLSAELREEKPGGEIVIAALVEQITVQLLRHHANMRRSDEMELSRSGLLDRRIRRSIELMHAQLGHELTLKEIAAASYLSTFHFARVFKKLTGTTPHAYLAGIRTTRAQSLLADPDLSITEISSLVGYSSPSHFTKAFREATGVTPRAFRQALW